MKRDHVWQLLAPLGAVAALSCGNTSVIGVTEPDAASVVGAGGSDALVQKTTGPAEAAVPPVSEGTDAGASAPTSTVPKAATLTAENCPSPPTDPTVPNYCNPFRPIGPVVLGAPLAAGQGPDGSVYVVTVDLMGARHFAVAGADGVLYRLRRTGTYGSSGPDDNYAVEPRDEYSGLSYLTDQVGEPGSEYSITLEIDAVGQVTRMAIDAPTVDWAHPPFSGTPLRVLSTSEITPLLLSACDLHIHYVPHLATLPDGRTLVWTTPYEDVPIEESRYGEPVVARIWAVFLGTPDQMALVTMPQAVGTGNFMVYSLQFSDGTKGSLSVPLTPEGRGPILRIDGQVVPLTFPTSDPTVAYQYAYTSCGDFPP
jgi:hypothetical protein